MSKETERFFHFLYNYSAVLLVEVAQRELPFLFYKSYNLFPVTLWAEQHAKKVVSNSLGLVGFAIRLVNSVFNLPDGQVIFYEEFE